MKKSDFKPIKYKTVEKNKTLNDFGKKCKICDGELKPEEVKMGKIHKKCRV